MSQYFFPIDRNPSRFESYSYCSSPNASFTISIHRLLKWNEAQIQDKNLGVFHALGIRERRAMDLITRFDFAVVRAHAYPRSDKAPDFLAAKVNLEQTELCALPRAHPRRLHPSTTLRLRRRHQIRHDTGVLRAQFFSLASHLVNVSISRSPSAGLIELTRRAKEKPRKNAGGLPNCSC